MRASRMMFFSDLIEKNKRIFKVPVYQRNYDWTNIQCEKLYYDIIEAFKKDKFHFTGTVVYIDDINGGSGLNEVLIIDGQQRITTMYILLKALLDSSIDKNNVRIENELKEVMYNRNCEEKYKVKLKPVKTDDAQLINLVNNKIDEMDRNSNIYKNYILFKNLIEKTISFNIELSDILYGIKKIEIVEIVLDKLQGDEPQKIFESINSTGLELSLGDLIRNYLLMEESNQDELYSNYWIPIEKNVGYSKLGDFFINYINSEVTKTVNLKNAYNIFKENCEDKNLTHKEVLENLKRKSKCYGAFIGENEYYTEKLRSKLQAFFNIKQTTVLPLIFKLFDDYENNNITENILCDVLDYLFTYILRMITCEKSKNLNKFVKSAYQRALKNNYEDYYIKIVSLLNNTKSNDRIPTDEEFKNALITKPIYAKPICKYLLSIIENTSKEKINVSDLTIEHILPQKEDSVIWKKEIGEDYTRVYEHYLHTLGNLTITGHNSELGTKSFFEKKKIIEEKSKANILNKDVLSVDKWNEESILNRAKKLSDKILEKFPLVNVDYEIKDENELIINILDDYDFSYQKPEGFSFLGEFIKAKTWVEVLANFIELCYELDEQSITKFARLKYQNINISNDERDFIKPRQIGNSGIFYETNRSSNDIVLMIREIIKKLDVDFEEFDIYILNSFDKNNQNTWDSEKIKVGQLFFNFIDDLIQKNKIIKEEIENLKTKEYSNNLFTKTYYPIISNKHERRYRKNKLQFNSEEIYITTEFYEEDREKIIEWYLSHI